MGAYLVLSKPKGRQRIIAVIAPNLKTYASIKRVVMYLNRVHCPKTISRVCGAVCNYLGWGDYCGGVYLDAIQAKDLKQIVLMGNEIFLLDRANDGEWFIREHITHEQ